LTFGNNKKEDVKYSFVRTCYLKHGNGKRKMFVG